MSNENKVGLIAVIGIAAYALTKNKQSSTSKVSDIIDNAAQESALTKPSTEVEVIDKEFENKTTEFKIAPMLSTMKEIVYELDENDNKRFPQFGKIEMGNLQYKNTGNTYSGFNVSSIGYQLKYIDIEIENLKSKLQNEDFGKPKIPMNYLTWANQAVDVITNPNSKREFTLALNYSSGPIPSIIVARQGNWYILFNFIQSELKRLKSNDLQSYIKAQQDYMKNTNSSVFSEELRTQYNSGKFFLYSSDYTQDKYDFLSLVSSYMQHFELSTSIFTDTQGPGLSFEAENNKSYLKSDLEKLNLKINELGGLDPETAKSEFRNKILELEINAQEMRNIVDYYNRLLTQEFNKNKYVKILKDEFHPDTIREIKEEINKGMIEFYKNECRPSSDKKILSNEIKTNEQITYSITREFYNFKIDLLRSIVEYVDKYKYTELAPYKRSELIKQGYEGNLEIPTSFIQWANVPFEKNQLGIAVASLTELYQATMFFNDPRAQWEFTVKVSPLLENFDLEFKKQVDENPNPSIPIDKFNNLPLMDKMKELVIKIEQMAKSYNTSIFAIAKDRIPSSIYSYYRIDEIDYRVANEPMPKTKDKMREIISEREILFTKVFPFFSVSFENMRHRAYYFFRINEASKKIAGYFNKLEKELEKKAWQKRIFDAESGHEQKFGNEYDQRLELVKNLSKRVDLISMIEQVEKFQYDKKGISEDIKEQENFIVEVNNKEQAFRSSNDTLSIEYADFMLDSLIPYLKYCLIEKKKVYDFIRGTGIESLRKKVFDEAIFDLNSSLTNKTFKISDGNFLFPRQTGQISNPSINYSNILSVDVINKYLNLSTNPIGKSNSALLLSKVEYYPISLNNYIDLYIKLAGVQTVIIERAKSHNVDYTKEEDFVFYNYLYYKLLNNFNTEYDIRTMISIVSTISGYTVGKYINNNLVETNLKTELYDRIARMEQHKSSLSYDKMFPWKKLSAIKNFTQFAPQDFVDTTVFSPVEIDILNFGFLDMPDLNMILDYADKWNVLPMDAIKELDFAAVAYLKFLGNRVAFNQEFDHDNWVSMNPVYRNMLRQWNMFKFELAKTQMQTVDDIFKELVSYLEYYEAKGTDEGWTGKYSYLFKSSRGISNGNLQGWNPFKAVRNIVSDITETVISPLEQSATRLATLPVDVVKGAAEGKLSLSQITSALEDAVKIGNIILISQLKLAKLVLSPVGQAFKEGVYSIIPEKYFDPLERISHIPGHIVEGKFDKREFSQAIKDSLYVSMMVSGQYFTMKYTSKTIDTGIANSSFIAKLDLYSGGLLTSTSNLEKMPIEIAEGRKIDKTYILMRSIDAMKVGMAVVAGPAVVGIQTGSEMLIGETNIGKNEYLKTIVRAGAMAATVYVTADQAAADAAEKEALKEGASKTAAKAAGEEAGKKAAQDMTVKAAVKQTATMEAKTQTRKVLVKEADEKTGLSKTELGRSALNIGIGATVDSIDSKKGFSDFVKNRAKEEAIKVAKAKADEQLKQIDPNLSVDVILTAYDLKDKDLKQIINDGRDKFQQYVQSGGLKKDAEKEADRLIQKQIINRFQDELSKYSENMLMFLMNKYGPHWNYDALVKPEDYLLYQEWIYVYQMQQEPRLFKFNYKKPIGKYAAIIGGVVALGWLALEE